MTIKITEKTVGVWYVSINIGNIILHLWWDDDGGYSVVGRVRFYDPKDPGNDAFSGQDEKEWFGSKFGNVSKEDALKKARNMIDRISLKAGNDYDELLMAGDMDRFFKEFMAKPWAKMKVLS